MKFSKAKLLVVWLMLLSMPSASMAVQSKAMTRQEQSNLKMVLDWWREVIQARHPELAPKYAAEDLIQHNPNFPQGRAAVINMISSRPPVNPIPASIAQPPAAAFAKGDYVVLVWDHEDKDPADPSRTYKYNSFDAFRIQNGKIQEHWDSAMRNTSAPPSAAAPRSSTPAPQQLKLTPEEQKIQEIAIKEFKDMLQYGHVELAQQYMAPGYIQHNPNVPPGRDGFVQFMSRNRQPEPIKEEWKNKPALILTSGNLVFFMQERTAKDPADPNRTYTYNTFDMVRVDKGQIQEHWDAAKKNPPPAQQPTR